MPARPYELVLPDNDEVYRDQEAHGPVPWSTCKSFPSREAAIEWAQLYLGADAEGRIRVVQPKEGSI